MNDGKTVASIDFLDAATGDRTKIEITSDAERDAIIRKLEEQSRDGKAITTLDNRPVETIEVVMQVKKGALTAVERKGKGTGAVMTVTNLDAEALGLGVKKMNGMITGLVDRKAKEIQAFRITIA
jgi:hypothetical protein